MKKLVAIMLTVFIMLLMSGIMLVYAAEYTVFTPSAAPGKTTEETTIETGISGMTLTIGADNWTYVASSFSSSSGNKYTGYIQGITYPSPEQKIGTYYTFTFDNTNLQGKARNCIPARNKWTLHYR